MPIVVTDSISHLYVASLCRRLHSCSGSARNVPSTGEDCQRYGRLIDSTQPFGCTEALASTRSHDEAGTLTRDVPVLLTMVSTAV